MEINEKIENLNLIALRKYACGKVANEKEWFLKCLECDGVDGCSCGRRVRDILDNATKPGDDLGERDRLFMAAWKTGDPCRYLVDNGHYKTLSSAGNALRKWIKDSGLISEEEHEEYYRRMLSKSGKEAGRVAIERTRKQVIDIFEGTTTDEEKRRAFLKTYTPSYKVMVLYNRALKWSKVYPDLEEKYHFVDACRVFGKNNGKTVGEFLAEMDDRQEESGMDDEMSLDDFLKETDDESFAPTLGDKLDKEAEKAHIELVAASPAQLTLQQEFGRKRKAFREKIESLGKEISDLIGKRNKLMEQMKLLDEAAELFGLKAVNH